MWKPPVLTTKLMQVTNTCRETCLKPGPLVVARGADPPPHPQPRKAGMQTKGLALDFTTRRPASFFFHRQIGPV